MLRNVSDHLLRALVSIFLGTVNTLFWTGLLLVVAILKLIIPVRAWRTFCSRIINGIAANWTAVNNWGLDLTKKIHWDVRGTEGLNPKSWYLVLANHQSWTDILVLQRVFHHKAPLLKFFLKKELRWVPVLGLAWWALDFPFMKRYSRVRLEKKPHLRGKDLQRALHACDKFKILPVAVMNFVEGTRFTRARHREQESPYRNLLKPKAGGIANVLSCMGDQLSGILNVTIVYPQGPVSFWQFLCRKAGRIRVRIETLPVSRELLGDYLQDQEYRQRIQSWLNQLWEEKDRQIERLLSPGTFDQEAAH
jgi:1-acyl-sn-glycerol-3-phosphate acyltransferase